MYKELNLGKGIRGEADLQIAIIDLTGNLVPLDRKENGAGDGNTATHETPDGQKIFALRKRVDFGGPECILSYPEELQSGVDKFLQSRYPRPMKGGEN